MTATLADDPLALDAALNRLKQAVGDGGWSTDKDVLATANADWRGRFVGNSPLILWPRTVEQVSAIVTIAAETGIAIVPQGGNTSLCGAATPGDEGEASIILSLSRMNRLRMLDTINHTMTVEAGMRLDDVKQAAEEAGLFFPLALASSGSCMIGGNLSTNAGGTNVLKYGNARELVLGLEVVLPDGRVWNGLQGLRKDNTGYDLKQLFLGAEGTLGVITAAVLKLFPYPNAVETAYCAVPDLKTAIDLLAWVRAETGDAVDAFEFMPRLILDLVLRHIPASRDPFSQVYDHYVLLELSTSASDDGELKSLMERTLAKALEKGLILDASLAVNDSQRQDFWRLRENTSDAQRREGVSIKHDISLPISNIAGFYDLACERVRELLPDAGLVGYGHLGDGNLHYNIQAAAKADQAAFKAATVAVNRIIHDTVREFGGSISAEHGIGQLKRDELTLYKDVVSLDLMKIIKSTLDPNNIMNPGKVV